MGNTQLKLSPSFSKKRFVTGVNKGADTSIILDDITGLTAGDFVFFHGIKSDNPPSNMDRQLNDYPLCISAIDEVNNEITVKTVDKLGNWDGNGEVGCNDSIDSNLWPESYLENGEGGSFFTAPKISGENDTPVAANKLIDNSVDFIAAGVVVGDYVENLTDGRGSEVMAVSANELTLLYDVFTAGSKRYAVGHTWRSLLVFRNGTSRTGNNQNNILMEVKDIELSGNKSQVGAAMAISVGDGTSNDLLGPFQVNWINIAAKYFNGDVLQLGSACSHYVNNFTAMYNHGIGIKLIGGSFPRLSGLKIAQNYGEAIYNTGSIHANISNSELGSNRNDRPAIFIGTSFNIISNNSIVCEQSDCAEDTMGESSAHEYGIFFSGNNNNATGNIISGYESPIFFYGNDNIATGNTFSTQNIRYDKNDEHRLPELNIGITGNIIENNLNEDQDLVGEESPTKVLNFGITTLDTNSGTSSEIAVSLEDGQYPGQTKSIIMTAYGGDSGCNGRPCYARLYMRNHADEEGSATSAYCFYDSAGEYMDLEWDGTRWNTSAATCTQAWRNNGESGQTYPTTMNTWLQTDIYSYPKGTLPDADYYQDDQIIEIKLYKDASGECTGAACQQTVTSHSESSPETCNFTAVDQYWRLRWNAITDKWEDLEFTCIK